MPGRERWAAHFTVQMFVHVIVSYLDLQPTRGEDFLNADSRPCHEHSDCGNRDFCHLRTCQTSEGFQRTCGTCEACHLCRYNRYAIDEECPAWCGLPPEETSFLRGVFISTPGASQEDLIHGHGGGCLIVWRFEGALFQRYRTGMNYTSLSLLPFTENPADSVFDRMLKNAHDPLSDCGEPSLMTGRFEMTAPPGGGGTLVTFSVPYDFSSTNYHVYTARMYQAIPSGLDLFWLSSSLGAASLDECGIFNDESRAERLLPMGSPLEGKGAKLDDGYDFSCGNFEIFDSVCQACFEQVKFTSRMPGMGNQTQSVVPLRFWIMNTWACNVGPAVLPWHRDEMQVGNKVRQDNLNAGETLVPGAHWTQTYGLRSMDTDTREIREGTQEERARGGKSPGESRELLQVKYQTLPGNATDWLLYNRQLSIPENYLMSGILASNDSKCQRLGFVDARTHVSPSYVKELDSCEAEGCVTCPRDFLCASFLMIPHIYDRIYAEKERLLNQSVITWLPISVFRCVGCGKFRGYQVANGECVDRDECITNSHDCHETNVCINTVGSFECQCKRGFESKGIGSEAGQSCVTCPRVCEDMDECLESRFYAGETSTLPPINCGRNGKCTNTHGSYFCECVTDGFESVYSDFGAHSCASKSTVVFEHAWMVGNKIGFFVSWDIKQAPHPQDVISIETETILSTPECDEYVQLFTPELCPKPEWGNAGCGSQLSLMVGSSGVMACQVRPNNTQAWASQVIQQKSTGPGMYYVRVFSYSAQEIVAQDGKLYTSDNIPGLELPADGGALAWPGGLTSCKPPSGMTDPWALGATDCQTVLVLTLIEGEIPVVQDESIPTRCGDGKLSPSNNEQCDDGNDIKGDGCDDACVIEINSACSYKSNDNVTSWSQEVSPGESVLMYQWVPGESTCERRKCGDGKINLDGEQCDDGNIIDLDGCDSKCKVERGFDCVHLVRMDTAKDPPEEVHEEVCEPFVLKLNATTDTYDDCPSCHKAYGECVIYAHKKYCQCINGFSSQPRGFEGDNRLLDAASIALQPHHCEDIHECQFKVGVCPGALCQNTPGSFNCFCVQGFNYSGLDCEDIDECNQIKVSGDEASDLTPCADLGGICLNTPGSFECRCSQGFVGSGYTKLDGCTDVDECILGSHICGRTQTCVNIPSSFYCQCNRETFERKGAECFAPNFYRENAMGLNIFGSSVIDQEGERAYQSGKPSWLQGLARLWDVPDSSAGFSVGMMQLLVNHAREKFATQWSDFRFSPQDSEMTMNRAYMLTAVYSEGNLSTSDLSLWECSPDACPDCRDSFSDPYTKNDPNDGGGARMISVVKKLTGLLEFPASLSTSNATWTWSFEPHNGSELIESLWVKWNSINLSSASRETLAICSQHPQEMNDLFTQANTIPWSSGVDLTEFRSFHVSRGTYSNEIELEKEFSFKDKDENRQLDMLEWLGSNCTNYSATNPPPQGIQEVKTPFTLELRVDASMPGSISWNFAQSPSDVKFSLTFSASKRNVHSFGAATDSNSIAFHKNTAVTAPVRRFMSFRNDVGIQVPPCAVKRHGLNDAYSTLKLTSINVAVKSALQGQWTGTCNPRLRVEGVTCVVDLNLSPRTRAFELVISGCGGFGVTNYAAGTMIEQNETLPWTDPGTQRIAGSFQDYLIYYDHGVPDRSGTGWVGKATAFVDGQCDGETCFDLQTQSVTLNIFRPGESAFFPSQVVQSPDVQNIYPCQVLRLNKKSLDPVGSMKSKELLRALKLRFRYLALYREFNTSLNIAIQKAGIACTQSMSTFFNSSLSILDPFSSISSSDCLSPCFRALNKSLSDLATTSGALWGEFLDLEPTDQKRASWGLSNLEDAQWLVNTQEYRDIHKFFAARVLHVAEFLARSSLACVGNYKNVRCHEVVPLLVKSTCRKDSGGSRHVVDLSSWAIDPLDGVKKQEGVACDQICVEDVENVLENGHCCMATLSVVQKRWAALVLQKRPYVTFDFSAYRCLYSSVFKERKCSNSKSEIVTATSPPSGSVQEGCKAEVGGQSLECAFASCIPQSPPPQCCPGIECENGGRLPYIGACYCICLPPYVDRDCGQQSLQVLAAITIDKTSFATFTADLLLSRIADLISVDPLQMQLAYVKVFKETRRGQMEGSTSSQVRRKSNMSEDVGRSDNKAIPNERLFQHVLQVKTRRSESKWKFIAHDQVLEVGFRIVSLSSDYQAMRTVEMLNRAMLKGWFSSVMSKLGLSMPSTTFTSNPRSVKKNGKPACVDEREEGQLFCGDFSGKDIVDKPKTEEAPGKSPISLALILGLATGFLFLVVCFGCHHVGVFRAIYGWFVDRMTYEKNRRKRQKLRLEWQSARFADGVNALKFDLHQDQKQMSETPENLVKMNFITKESLKGVVQYKTQFSKSNNASQSRMLQDATQPNTEMQFALRNVVPGSTSPDLDESNLNIHRSGQRRNTQFLAIRNHHGRHENEKSLDQSEFGINSSNSPSKANFLLPWVEGQEESSSCSVVKSGALDEDRSPEVSGPDQDFGINLHTEVFLNPLQKDFAGLRDVEMSQKTRNEIRVSASLMERHRISSGAGAHIIFDSHEDLKRFGNISSPQLGSISSGVLHLRQQLLSQSMNRSNSSYSSSLRSSSVQTWKHAFKDSMLSGAREPARNSKLESSPVSRNLYGRDRLFDRTSTAASEEMVLDCSLVTASPDERVRVLHGNNASHQSIFLPEGQDLLQQFSPMRASPASFLANTDPGTQNSVGMRPMWSDPTDRPGDLSELKDDLVESVAVKDTRTWKHTAQQKAQAIEISTPRNARGPSFWLSAEPVMNVDATARRDRRAVM